MSQDTVSLDEGVIGFLDYNVDCSRTRYSIQIGLAVDFQIDSDHVSFGLPTQTAEGKQVPVLLANAAQVQNDTRDSMFQWVRGYCRGRTTPT